MRVPIKGRKVGVSSVPKDGYSRCYSTPYTGRSLEASTAGWGLRSFRETTPRYKQERGIKEFSARIRGLPGLFR